MTNVGKFIHSAGLFLHNLFNGKTSAHDIANYAGDISATINIYKEVSAEVATITDPVQKATAVCQSILKHSTEFPAHMQGGDFTHYLVEACSAMTSLDLPTIEAIAKEVLAGTAAK